MRVRRESILILELKENLSQASLAFILLASVSFGIGIFLFAYLSADVNSRLGDTTNIYSMEADPADNSGVRFSLSWSNELLKISTSDRHIFNVDVKRIDSKATQDLVDYLKAQISRQLLSTTLSKRFRWHPPVLLAVSEELKYIHLRPVLYALARAGISQYAFETVIHRKK